MITTRTYKNISWIDIVSPTQDEVRKFIETHEINPEIGKDILLPSPKSHIEYYEGLVYLVLHFPVHKHSHTLSDVQEVDFLIGKDFIATIHYEAFDPLEEFSKYIDVSVGKEYLPHAGYFFFEILKHIYDSIRDDVSAISDELKDIEPRIFSGKEKDVVHVLSILNRSLLGFQEALGVQRELLELSAVYTKSLFGKSFEQVSFIIINEHGRLTRHIDHVRNLVRELRETNNTLLSTKQNEVMKNIAMVSFITFPLSLLVAIFELRISTSTGSSYEFWAIVILLLVAAIGMLFFFKKKQWL